MWKVVQYENLRQHALVWDCGVWIKKIICIVIEQLFFEIEVNILPLFTEIEKNNCFSIYTGNDLNIIFRRKPLKIVSETLAKREFTPAILFLFGSHIIHSVGGE